MATGNVHDVDPLALAAAYAERAGKGIEELTDRPRVITPAQALPVLIELFSATAASVQTLADAVQILARELAIDRAVARAVEQHLDGDAGPGQDGA